MQIAYLTMDDVNLDRAAQTASECGVTLAPLPPEGVMPNGLFGAVLYDLDQYDSRRGQAVLTELLSCPAPLPVGLHGHSLGDEEIAALRANGVVVSQPFDPEMVRSLCRAAGRSQAVAPAPVEDHQDSPEGIDDPATLCESVRSLASRSYQVLRRDARTSAAFPDEVAEILEWIARLERQIDQLRRLHKLQLEDLRNWVSSLRRRIESSELRPF